MAGKAHTLLRGPVGGLQHTYHLPARDPGNEEGWKEVASQSGRWAESTQGQNSWASSGDSADRTGHSLPAAVPPPSQPVQ